MTGPFPWPHLQQLSGLDAEFLAMESTGALGHVGSVCVVDAAAAHRPVDVERLASLLASRLHLSPIFRRRLVEVPLGLDHPYWADDPDFSLDRHVHEIALPEPADDARLAHQVARLHARPLDRRHPLWEMYLVTGLSGGRAAVYTKIHHAAMDGVSGDDFIAAVLDTDPRGRPIGPVPPWRPRPLPSGRALLSRSAASLAARPLVAARLGADIVRHAPGLAVAAAGRLPLPQALRLGDDPAATPGLRAPHTPFNAPITPHRRYAFTDVSLDQIKQVRRGAGVTVNDVVMALAAGALRRWLDDRGVLPAEPLVAAVPVDVRTGRDQGTYGNHVSVMFAALPTDVAQPHARLRAAAAAMAAAKRTHGTVPATLLADATSFAVPVVATLGWRLSARLHLMERVNPWNLFVSNVPGPREPLYCAGAPVLGYYPVSAIAHGQGLNITALSYTDRMCFGVLGCRTLVPDADRLAGYLRDELRLLLDADGAPDGHGA